VDVTVVFETGIERSIPPTYWWQRRRRKMIHQEYRRTFTGNPYGLGEKPNIRVGETINLDPGGKEQLLWEVKAVHHIDSNNVELVIVRRYIAWHDGNDKERREQYTKLISQLEAAQYQLVPAED
jgi:hypothetical protein